ncbi:MAG: flagellar biosynthetic protein FliO [Oscillospiraceae bacterium]|nr:flagellar biosynthetic protein FliO [Oscillospiraceae bacterium]
MEWLRLVLSLIGILGFIFLIYWMMRKVNKMSSGSKLRILDRAVTGRDSSLLVVSVSGRLMLVGVSSQRMEKLCDLEISEEEYFQASEYADKPVIKFGDVLSNFIKIGKKQEPMETKKAEGEEDTVESDNKTSNESEWF